MDQKQQHIPDRLHVHLNRNQALNGGRFHADSE